MKRILYAILLISFIAFAGLGIANIRQANHKVKLKEIELKDTSVQLKQLNEDYTKLLEQKQVDQQKLQELEQQKKKLEADLQAKAQQKEQERIALQTRANLSQVAYASGDAKAFIYQKESGNNPAAINSIGCRGLGQACPGSKLPCSNTDYACQDAWFTNYAMTRYGSWENAKAFWIQNHWW